jgi:hypothetical protein
MKYKIYQKYKIQNYKIVKLNNEEKQFLNGIRK